MPRRCTYCAKTPLSRRKSKKCTFCSERICHRCLSDGVVYTETTVIPRCECKRLMCRNCMVVCFAYNCGAKYCTICRLRYMNEIKVESDEKLMKSWTYFLCKKGCVYSWPHPSSRQPPLLWNSHLFSATLKQKQITLKKESFLIKLLLLLLLFFSPSVETKKLQPVYYPWIPSSSREEVE